MAQAKSKSSVKVKVQKFGTALSGMIMPNIGAIIAWGLTAAFFMYPHGWFPNKEINNLVQPMLHYLLPLLLSVSVAPIAPNNKANTNKEPINDLFDCIRNLPKLDCVSSMYLLFSFLEGFVVKNKSIISPTQ